MVNHKVHHTVQDGRDPIIESYCKKSVEYALQMYKDKFNSDPEFFVDVGCDYAYASQRIPMHTNYFGMDPFATQNPFNKVVSNKPADVSYVNSGFSDLQRTYPHKDLGRNLSNQLFFLNHTLEHFENPSQAIENVRASCKTQDLVFIAVPHIDYDWARVEGHVTGWNKSWLDFFMSQRGFIHAVPPITVELRDNCVEIWGTYIRKEFA